MNDTVYEVIDGIGRLIMQAAITMQNERYHPRQDPDAMDAEIEHKSERVKVLRRIREQFENEMAQPAEPRY